MNFLTAVFMWGFILILVFLILNSEGSANSFFGTVGNQTANLVTTLQGRGGLRSGLGSYGGA